MPNLKKYVWLILPVFFLLYSAPSTLDYLFYFPDEKYYTDAALQMMDKNDWVTPYKADGSPRFLKPIVTYWLLLGSYKVFGVSPFSSRLLFWLAGSILVFIVYRMTLSLLKDNKTALLAGFITAANPLVLMGAGRSIPDILLVLFLTISSWGFLEILLKDHPRNKFYWMAYLGAAFAFETKGLPAAAFAGISILFLLLNPWKPVKLKQLNHLPAIATAIGVALSWFVIMYIKHGTEYLHSFFADQIGYRVSSKTAQVIKNTSLGLINLLAYSLPWILIAVSKPLNLRKYFINVSAEKKALFGFIALWVIAVIAMSGAVFKFYDRYLLPVIPLISLFFAMVILQTDTYFEKPARKIILVLNLLILFINVLYTVFIDQSFVLLAGTVTGIILFIFLVQAIKKIAVPGIGLSNSILLLWFNVHILLYTLLMPHPGDQLVETIKNEQNTGKESIYVYGNIRMASAIRIYSNHQLNVVTMDTLYLLPDKSEHLLVFNKKEEHLLDLEDYRLIKGSEEWKSVPANKFPGILQPAVEKLKASGTVYYIAKPYKK